MKSWQRLLGAVAIAAAGLAAAAAHAQRYAVISLIGDRMQIAYASGVEGQPVDRITRRYVALDDTTIDRAVLLAANDKLRELVPGSDPVLLQAFERTYFDIDAGTAGIIDWIRQLVRKEKGPRVTHAVIVTKMQYDGIPALQKPYVGSGTLEGVGFFVGRESPPAGAGPNAGGPGFLAPFAYFRLELIDIAKGAVLREEKVVASRTFANSHTANPWANLTNAEKIAVLQDIIRRETANAVPRLVGAGARF
jgi:hypothetical protein